MLSGVKYFCTTAITPLLLVLCCGPGCTSKDPSQNAIVPNQSIGSMSSKPPMHGVLTGNNFFNAVGSATGINLQNDSAAFASFDQNRNDLPFSGGMDASGNTLQRLADFSAQAAVALILSDAGKQLSDSTRILKSYNLNVAFTSPEGANTFTTTSQNALAENLSYSLTGLPPTEAEKLSLVNTMIELRAKIPDTIAGKRLLAEMMVAIVLVGQAW